MLDEVAAVMVTLTVVACVAEAAVPVTVKVYVPAAAVPALTVSVDDPPAVTLTGLRPALAPEGAPPTVSEMVSALPLVTAVEMLEVPLAFCARLSEVGVARMEKSFGGGGAVTVKVTVVACVADAAVPVTVSVYVPAAALPAFTVSVDDAPAVTLVGLKVALEPAGAPATESETVCALPLVTVVEMVELPPVFCTRLSELGLAAMAKSLAGGVALTVSVRVVACVAEGAEPLTVSVYVPGVAVPAFTVRVDAPPAVTLAGLRLALAPVGVPFTESETLSALPLVTAVEMVEVPPVFCTRVNAFGLALMEKLFGIGAFTVRVTGVPCVADGAVPVTVKVYVPGEAVPAFSESVEDPPAVTLVGLKEAMAPEGRPATERATVSAAPLTTVVETVDDPLAFAFRESEVGEARMEKSLLAAAPQPGNLKAPIRVCQLKAPFAERYSVVYQKVQSSLGSTAIIE
jgi:hypothetical protein